METSMAQEILGATDFSEAAGNAMARAAQLAQAHHCALRIVHVFNELAWTNVRRMLEESPLEPPPETAMRTLVALADELKSRHRLSTVHVQVQIGRASAEIIAVAHKTRPQLIVIGAQGEGLAKALMLGGTAIKIRPALDTGSRGGRRSGRAACGIGGRGCVGNMVRVVLTTENDARVSVNARR